MPPKFEIYKDAAAKFRFRLRSKNGEIIAAGESYEQHASVLKGVNSIQKNCNVEVEDLTAEDAPRISNPKYQVLQDEKGKYRFHLKASNGEIIAQSEGYETKSACINGIEALREACDAEIEDQTVTETATEETKAERKPAASAPVAETKKVSKIEPEPKTVFVGKKPPMDYVMAILTGLSQGKEINLTLKARGQAITTAVDSAEITRRRFLKDLKIEKISIGTEQMPPREGETKPRSVSTIEIVLTKGQ